jgi:hypothetical protein
MCSNISDRTNYSIPTTWDETAHVRYSENNTNAIRNESDFVWVQVSIVIPADATLGAKSGTIFVFTRANP